MSRKVGDLKARPTVYKGVHMRSRLEAAWAEQFDALGWAWEYEPICLANSAGQYLPDFRVQRPDSPRAMWWEIKGGWWNECDDDDYTRLVDTHDAEVARWYGLIHEHDPHASFVLAYQAWWGDYHQIEVRTPISLQPCPCDAHGEVLTGPTAGPSFSSAMIAQCAEGCATLVSSRISRCRPHELPLAPVQLVGSLYHPIHDGWQRPSSLYDPLALILDWKVT